MLGLFKKKNKEKEIPAILDLDGHPIEVGARVKCLRYDLGECIVELEGREYFYVSVKNGQRVSYTKMFDAATRNQKVEVIKDTKLRNYESAPGSGVLADLDRFSGNGTNSSASEGGS